MIRVVKEWKGVQHSVYLVPVYDARGQELNPCSPEKAIRLMEKGRARPEIANGSLTLYLQKQVQSEDG